MGSFIGNNVYDWDDKGNISNLNNFIAGAEHADGHGGSAISGTEGGAIIKKAIDDGMSAQDLVDSTGGKYNMGDLQSFVDKYYPNMYGQWARGNATGANMEFTSPVDVNTQHSTSQPSTIPKAAPKNTPTQATPTPSNYKTGLENLSLNAPPTATYTPATPVTAEVKPNQTAAWQLEQILGKDHPYIKQARLAGERYAASRGMVNSTIAGGASEAEAIKAALPIATNDANTYRSQALANQDAQNAAINLNSNLGLDASKANATILQSEVESQRNAETSRGNALLSAETQKLISLADNEVQMQVNQLSNESRERIAQMQIEQGASDNELANKTQAFGSMIGAISQIEANPDLSTSQKNEAINRTVSYYEQYMNYADYLLGKGGSSSASGSNNSTTPKSGNKTVDWASYVDSYPDLQAAFNAQNWEKDKAVWGKWHYDTFTSQDPNEQRNLVYF